MKMKILLSILLLIIIACASPKGNNKLNHLETPSNFEQQIKLAQSIGSMLYILDKASAIATDVMIENVHDYREKNLGGYITFREANEDGMPIDSYLVSFYTKDDPPKIIYEVHARMSNEHEFNEFNPPKQASSSFSYFVNARKAAIAAIPEITQPINPVLLPGDIFGKEGIVVYLLAGTTKPDVAVLGKHYRAYVDPNNDYDVEIEPLSKSEILIPLREESDERVLSLIVTQIVTDWPTEIHVFASLLYKVEIYVSTQSGLWLVDGTNISFLGE
ncbi:MAG: hypothetical protein ACFFCW_27530 [Candidatus Hodarchaeota archaeon]